MTFVDSLLATPADDGLLVLISLAMWSIIVLSIAWLITGCMRRTSAATRCGVWQFAIAVVLLIPALRSFVPGIPLGWRTDATAIIAIDSKDRNDFSTDNETESALDNEVGNSAALSLALPVTLIDTSVKSTPRQPKIRSDEPTVRGGQAADLPTTHMSWSNVVLTIWTIGVLGNLCWLVGSVLRARRLVRFASTDVDVRLKTMLVEVTGQMSWRRPIKLSVSPRVRVPLVMGPFRPRIVMPVEWTDWSPARIRIVLSHEVAHVVRRDVAWQLVTRLAAALYWINPLVWLAVRKVRTERETACDDVVLLAGVTATDYAAGLVEMVAELGGRRLNLLGAMGMAEQPQIEKRLRAILDDRSCRTPVSRHMRRVFLLGATTLAISLAMLRPFDSVAGNTPELTDKHASLNRVASPSPQATILTNPMIPAVDWPQWGGNSMRNNTPESKNIPIDWNVGRFDRRTGVWQKEEAKNIKWIAELGSQSYGSPVVADGRIYVGTNNGGGRLSRYPATVDLGCLLCFRESDGKFLWQHSSEKLKSGRNNDMPNQGICSTPLVEGKRLWFVTSRGEVRCLDTEGFSDDENNGPFKDETVKAKDEADVIWVFDMMQELKVFPHNMSSCSVTTLGEILFVNTSNGVNHKHYVPPASEAPSFIAMDKNTGKVLWTDKSPGDNILDGQWSSPAVAVLGGVPQVIFAGGDGWLYSFLADAGSGGKPELLWKFDGNPKDSEWILGGRGGRSDILATPVIHDGLVYFAMGQDPEHAEGLGRLWCVDPTKRGDVSAELAVHESDLAKSIPHRRLQAVDSDKGELAIANPNSAVVWHYTGSDRDLSGDNKIDFEETMHRSCGTVAIKDGLLFISDFSGLFHCLDAKTGKAHWTYDMLAEAWGSPLIVDGKVFISDQDGDIAIFNLSAKPHEPIAENNMGNAVYTTPVVANGVLYIANKSHLFAIKTAGK